MKEAIVLFLFRIDALWEGFLAGRPASCEVSHRLIRIVLGDEILEGNADAGARDNHIIDFFQQITIHRGSGTSICTSTVPDLPRRLRVPSGLPSALLPVTFTHFPSSLISRLPCVSS